jgi:hypothetical protein
MAYSLYRTPAIDSMLLTSCENLAPTQANGAQAAFTFNNEQSDYWNIDDILAEEELVPCSFKSDAQNLGYLSALAHNAAINKRTGGASMEESGTLQANQKIDLPLWLAVALAQRDLCELKAPVYMTEKYLNLLQADPEVVNLRNQSFSLYESVLKLCSHMSEEHIYEFVTKYQRAFIQRFGRLVIEMADSTETQHNEAFTTDMKRMTNLERELFDLHKRQRVSF